MGTWTSLTAVVQTLLMLLRKSESQSHEKKPFFSKPGKTPSLNVDLGDSKNSPAYLKKKRKIKEDQVETGPANQKRWIASMKYLICTECQNQPGILYGGTSFQPSPLSSISEAPHEKKPPFIQTCA
ncbi:unnamed protein product [Ranitomeya imitator]|uniref:Uncharacterized protein n=1 Tax=Ranitomeya imitator TaxID=111125 RepID=A0ABN9M2T9_9NEOB|nr:unnamed protein product [Ranitomeya imitator]